MPRQVPGHKMNSTLPCERIAGVLMSLEAGQTESLTETCTPSNLTLVNGHLPDSYEPNKVAQQSGSFPLALGRQEIKIAPPRAWQSCWRARRRGRPTRDSLRTIRTASSATSSCT
jgi:hypothetical protein